MSSSEEKGSDQKELPKKNGNVQGGHVAEMLQQILSRRGAKEDPSCSRFKSSFAWSKFNSLKMPMIERQLEDMICQDRNLSKFKS